MKNDIIAVDISKINPVHRTSDGASCRFTNDKAGHSAFLVWLKHANSRIVYEPSGPMT